MGLGLAAYSVEHVDFIASLPLTEAGAPNFNLVFPAFVEREFAPGIVGLAIVRLFATAMSSIDSALSGTNEIPCGSSQRLQPKVFWESVP